MVTVKFFQLHCIKISQNIGKTVTGNINKKIINSSSRPIKSETRQQSPLSPIQLFLLLQFNILLKVLVNTIRHETELRNEVGKRATKLSFAYYTVSRKTRDKLKIPQK